METSKNINQPRSAGAPPTASKKAASNKPQGAEAPDLQGNGGTNENAGDKDLLQQAKDTTSQIMNQVQERAGSQLSQQKETTANELSTVVNAVRQFGENLSREGNGPIARYASEYGNKAADGLERFTNYIRQQDGRQLLNDVQDFGRRQPVLLISGAFLLGFAGARLIKSSMDTGSQSQRANTV